MKLVHHHTQSALFHLYFALLKFVSATLIVIVTAVFLQFTLLLSALNVGDTVSYIVVIVFDAVLLFHAESVATDHHTLTATAHCALGVIIILYTLVLTVMKLVTVQLVTLTSHVMKFDTASLNVQVTTNVPLTYVDELLVNATLGCDGS